MSIVLQGSTSGSITLQEPAVAGTTVLDLPAVSGTILTTTSPKAGNVLQVVSANYSTIASTTGTTFVDSGLSASITPSSSSSKILIIVSMNGLYNGGATSLGHKLSIVRNSTNINLFCTYTNYIGTATPLITTASSNYLDSPNTTSSTTYKIQFAKADSSSGTVSVQHNSDVSTITLLEIAA